MQTQHQPRHHFSRAWQMRRADSGGCALPCTPVHRGGAGRGLSIHVLSTTKDKNPSCYKQQVCVHSPLASRAQARSQLRCNRTHQLRHIPIQAGLILCKPFPIWKSFSYFCWVQNPSEPALQTCLGTARLETRTLESTVQRLQGCMAGSICHLPSLGGWSRHRSSNSHSVATVLGTAWKLRKANSSNTCCALFFLFIL